MNLEDKALVFATAAHAAIGQTRKYTKEPYINHPIRVKEIMDKYAGNVTDTMRAAALLHDVVEDTDISLDLIEEQFGSEVMELVFWLTDKSKKSDGNRKLRKAIDRESLARAPAEAQTIKLADLIDNSDSIEKYDASFWKVYSEEKKALLEVLTKGDTVLQNIAQQMLGGV